MKIEILDRPGPDWDSFAEGHPDCCLGHAGVWGSILGSSYGMQPFYLSARDSEGILQGILPLVAFRGRPGGRPSLVSLPFLDSAGIVAADPRTRDALLTRAIALCGERGFSGLELRSNLGPIEDAGSRESLDRVNLVLGLQTDTQAQWNLLRAKVRNQCRKAEREELAIADGEATVLLDEFYRVFQVNMRDLGSPVHSIRFFRTMAEQFGGRLRVVVTRLKGDPVGGLIAIRFGSRVYVPWASTLRAERNRCPNNQIYWEAICWAIRSGAKRFDFGRSPIDGGTYRFKLGWGATDESLAWRRFDATGQSVPQTASVESPLLRTASNLWTRLPVPLASAVGSRIRRYFSN